MRALRHFAFTAEFAKRRRRLWETAQKKDGENSPFCGVDLVSSLRNWSTRRDSQGRIAVFFNSPFNADGVASKTHFASVTSFRFHCGVRQKEAQTLGNGTKKGGRKPSLLWRRLDVKPPILAYPSGLVRTHCSVFQFNLSMRTV